MEERKKCWEIINCSEKVRKKCPAYPDKGYDCWKITGTKCKGGTVETATLKEKLVFCKECKFYVENANKV